MVQIRNSKQTIGLYLWEFAQLPAAQTWSNDNGHRHGMFGILDIDIYL
jgi:hypothetical protein